LQVHHSVPVQIQPATHSSVWGSCFFFIRHEVLGRCEDVQKFTFNTCMD